MRGERRMNVNEIRLNRLSLRDFQGGTFVLEANGTDVFIFAANAVGKTRIVSAFTWLLFNKDALGRSDFELKNLDSTGEAAHGLEHTVEAELEIDNGERQKKITLKKTYREVWSKKRGSAERTFTGHKVDYWIDGVPIQEKDYLARIAETAGDESRFRLLTSPTTFPQLHWQKQRQLLLEICGDISDTDIIASNEKLFPLTAILGKRTLDDHRKIVTARRSEINKEMEKIPVRIDEVRRGLPDVTGIDRGKAEKEVEHFENALNDAKLRLQGIDSGGVIAELSKRLSGLNADLRKMEETHRSGSLVTLNRINQQISEVEAMANASRKRGPVIDSDLKQKDSQVQHLNSDLSRLREQWAAVDAEIFKDTISDTISDTCPVCGQSLPSDQVQAAREKALAAREKALADFNYSKAEELKKINEKGMVLKNQRDWLQGEIEALNKEREIVSLRLPDEERTLKTLIEARDALKRSSEDFSGVPGRDALLSQILGVEAQIKAERDGKAQDVEKIKAEIAALSGELSGNKLKVQFFLDRSRGESRIEELKTEEKKLAAEFERLEGELYLIEQFIKTKVSMLTDRINGKFEVVRFKLFNVLINGGIEDCCEITVNGVPFNGGLNSAARTQAGADIIRTLQQHFGMRAPVFVDNRESVSELPKMDCQMINLVVSPEDKVLRIETATEAQNGKPRTDQSRNFRERIREEITT
jgi:hypothetical protein